MRGQLFVRLVGQYVSRRQDVLRDDGRTGRPILQLEPHTTGVYEARPRVVDENDFRFDALFSYRPTPGTVVFLGYGSTLAGGARLPLPRVWTGGRTPSSWSLSYLFRM